jgi:hypothetical protein
MKKIAFVCATSGRNEAGMLEQFKWLTPNHSGIWKDIQGVPTIEQADYYIVLEEFKSDFPNKYNVKKVIYFQGEPDSIRTNRIAKMYYKNFFAYFDYSNYYFPPFWSSRIPFDSLENLSYNKTKDISCIMSTKLNNRAPGYEQRQIFLDKLIQRHPNLHMDIYGRGRGNQELKYDDTCPKKAYDIYKYTLSCENCSIPGHATDRFYDSILNWTIPIYWGMTNIETLGLPEECYYIINVNNLKDIDKVYDIVMDNNYYSIIKYLEIARKKIMYELNFWEKIYQVLK